MFAICEVMELSLFRFWQLIVEEMLELEGFGRATNVSLSLEVSWEVQKCSPAYVPLVFLADSSVAESAGRSETSRGSTRADCTCLRHLLLCPGTWAGSPWRRSVQDVTSTPAMGTSQSLWEGVFCFFFS